MPGKQKIPNSEFRANNIAIHNKKKNFKNKSKKAKNAKPILVKHDKPKMKAIHKDKPKQNEIKELGEAKQAPPKRKCMSCARSEDEVKLLKSKEICHKCNRAIKRNNKDIKAHKRLNVMKQARRNALRKLNEVHMLVHMPSKKRKGMPGNKKFNIAEEKVRLKNSERLERQLDVNGKMEHIKRDLKDMLNRIEKMEPLKVDE